MRHGPPLRLNCHVITTLKSPSSQYPVALVGTSTDKYN